MRKTEADSISIRVTDEQWRSGADPGPDLDIETLTQGGPQDEQQRVGFTCTWLTGGSFTLTYNGQTTGSISYNATAAAVQSALEALSNVDVTGGIAVAIMTELRR